MTARPTFLEQTSLIVGLLISPRRLPLASRTASTPMAIAASILVGSMEALMLVAVPFSSSGTRWPDLNSYLQHLSVSAAVSVPTTLGLVSVPILILAFFIYCISDDEAPILRSILLAPLPLFIPSLIWGVSHAVHVIGTSVLRGSPGWTKFPLFGMLGGICLLPFFAMAAYGLILWSARVSMRIKLDPTLCRACGYPLRGLESNCCPECGTGFDRIRLAEIIRRIDAAATQTT